MKGLRLLVRDFEKEFYSLPLAANEPYERQPRGVPHCDCQTANEKFFGRKVGNEQRQGDSHAFTMVPTESKNGYCVYCGYVSPLQQPLEAEALKKYKASCASRTKALHEGKYRVRGTHIETGEQVEFLSAKHAYDAGYGSVQFALNAKRSVKGWVWERVRA